MADSPSPSSPVAQSNPQKNEAESPAILPNQLDPVQASMHPTTESQYLTPSASAPAAVKPNLNAPIVSAPPSPTISYLPTQVFGGAVLPPAPPSFRPLPMQTPQFSPLPNSVGVLDPNYPSPGVQPPGVGSSVSGVVPMSIPQGQMQPMMSYQVPPGQPPNPALRSYAPIPNGYNTILAAHQGTMPHQGIPRYPPPYGAMIRPAYPPRHPGAIGVLPAVSRPPFAGIPPVRPIIPPVRPGVAPNVIPAEKPQTTVYVGKIAPTVENDFMLSLLQLCGPVKSWKRAPDPTDGTPRGFGFCEFESAEGVLRALRLLSKFNIDGQELLLKVNQAMREYLERYVEKRSENLKKQKETQAAGPEKEDESAESVANDLAKPITDDSKKEDNDLGNKEDYDITEFGIVTEEDREADQEALEKLTKMMEERSKTKSLPPPPPPPPPSQVTDGSGNTNSESRSRDGDSGVDIAKSEAAEDNNDEETNSDNKPTSEHDRPETNSPDRSRRYDRRSRDKDRDLKREKEREIERYEREAERERVRKDREQKRKIEVADRQYEERLKEWEYREREREKQRQHEKEREKERERKRKKEILNDDDDEDDDSRKRWRRNVVEDKRKKRLREKEDDLADREKEEEEILEAKQMAEVEQQQKQQRDALKLLSDYVINGSEKTMVIVDINVKTKENANEQDNEGSSESHKGDGSIVNGNNDESTIELVAMEDTQQNMNAPAKKLGFGLVGSGKRTAVRSVFHEEEDDDAQKDKKMRPLVPIDYSTEELQAVQPAASGASPPNLVAAAEFAKRISTVNPKEEKLDAERDRRRRSNEKSNQRDRERVDEDGIRSRDESKEKLPDHDKDRGHGVNKLKTSENKKLLDAKQLIDMIPKTKEELFSYEINWAVYDKHELHERMRPWVSKKITDFLGEEETSLVDYIVSSTQEHVNASQMLELLQSILDDEAEMFVLKMWRTLIFEIKKVETGLAGRSKS